MANSVGNRSGPGLRHATDCQGTRCARTLTYDEYGHFPGNERFDLQSKGLSPISLETVTSHSVSLGSPFPRGTPGSTTGQSKAWPSGPGCFTLEIDLIARVNDPIDGKNNAKTTSLSDKCKKASTFRRVWFFAPVFAMHYLPLLIFSDGRGDTAHREQLSLFIRVNQAATHHNLNYGRAILARRPFRDKLCFSIDLSAKPNAR
jgi:hypothetical protein